MMSTSAASSIDKAVILAAGMGNRISALGQKPKPLLSLDGSDHGDTFLDFHLRCLARAGVKEIYLVGNQKTYQAPLTADVPVRWILNPSPDLSLSGSGHSAQYAWRHEANILDGRSRVLLMDADIVYDPTVFELFKDPQLRGSQTLVSPTVKQDSEEVLVFAADSSSGRAVRHGKGLARTAIVNGLELIGEATGIVLLDAEDHDFYRQATDWLIQYSTAKTRSEHEDITQLLMTHRDVRILRLPSEALFMEVDTPLDYSRLTLEVWPAIKQRHKL